MYNVSTEFKNKIKQNSRRIAGKLLLGNLELTPEDIINMNMEYSLGNDGIPAIGGAVASKLEVKLSRDKLPPVLTTQELKPFLGIEIAPGTIEYVPMGVFRISPKDTKKTDKTISLVGYDILFILENSPYNSNLKFPNTFNNIKTELETKGLRFASQTLTNVTIKEKPKTIRELLSDISELLGMNVVTNKIGQIEFRQLNVVEFGLDANNYYDFKLLADDDVKLTRLTVEKEGEENENLTYGDDTGYTIKIKNDSITTQNELRTAYDRVFPLSYTAYECNMQGMPHIEVGDIINLTDRHGIERNIPIAYHRLSYSGGLRSEIRANAPSGAISSTGSTGSNSITQSLNDLRVNILEVNTVLADKVSTNELDANVARIEKIINTNLEAVNAKIDTIYTNDLTAINAHITALKGNVAEIDTILSKEIFTELASAGQIVAGSGIIADGAIGDAHISSLSADKLDAGAVRTALVDIIGPDGRLKLSGNKLQIFDGDGLDTLYERIFLGVDDENNANLTLRGADGKTVLLTQDGLTDVGFTDGYNKLDDNSLDPKKIDIQKVVTRINEGIETIQASKIIIDNTTLDLSFNTIKNTITSQGEEINNQRSEINALDNAIKFKVDNQTFNQYRTTNDGNITTINNQLSKNTASIDVLQEEIAFKVSQVDVEKLISDIEVGGRNYIRSNDYSQDNEHQTIVKTDELFEGQPIYKATKKTASTPPTFLGTLNILEGETYTISIWVKHDQEPAKNYSLLSFYKDVHLARSYGKTFGEWERVITIFTNNTGEDIENVNIYYYPASEAGEVTYFTCPKLERGNKATDWTPAPEDFESEITAINTKVTGIDIALDSITSRVSSTESNVVKVNDEVSAIESRVSTAEQKITDSAIVTTVRNSTAYINDLDNKANQSDLDTATSKITTLEQTSENFKISINDYEGGKLKGAYYDFTGESAIFKGAGFVILNNDYTSVLQGDTEGNLSITGEFTTYRNGQKSIEMRRANIYMYDWEGATRTSPVGSVYSMRENSNENKPGIGIGHEKNSHFSIVYAANDTYYPYLDFDKDNILGNGTLFPIRAHKSLVFNDVSLGFRSASNKTYSRLFQGGNYGRLAVELNMRQKNNGLQVQSDTGTSLFGVYAGYDYPIECSHNTLVRGNFSVTGTKNSLQQTENYGDRLINAYETTEYYFGDIGSGFIGEDGLCYIHIDEILQECINSAIQYHVFLQKCGKGEAWVKERHPNYFVVEGTPALEFSWELKAKRRGYEHHRLECPFSSTFIDNSDINNELTKKDEKREELEAIFDKELECDLSKKLLTGGWEE